MTSRICICCGAPIFETKSLLSRNPNMCASCSSLTDGMDEMHMADFYAGAENPLTEDEPVSNEPTEESPVHKIPSGH